MGGVTHCRLTALVITEADGAAISDCNWKFFLMHDVGTVASPLGCPRNLGGCRGHPVTAPAHAISAQS